MAVQPIDWNAGGNVTLGDLYKGQQVRNDTRRAAAYERMADAQSTATDEAARRKAALEAVDFTARAGNAVLQAPPDQRPQLYAMALEEGRRLGLDMSRMPAQYDAATEGLIKFSVARAMPLRQQLTRGRAAGGGAGGGYALDPPYQPAATPPEAPPGAIPPAQPPTPQQPGTPVPAPPVAQRPQAPMPQAQPSTAGGARPVGINAAIDSIQPQRQPVAAPGNYGPSTSVAMPQPAVPPVGAGIDFTRRPAPAPVAPPAAVPAPQVATQPPMAPAGAPPAVPPRDDAGQDRAPPVEPIGIPNAPAAAGPQLEPGDRLVRGRGGAVRTVNGMVEVRDAKGQTAFRPMVKPTPPEAPPKPPKERPLTETARKNLKELGGPAADMVEATSTFQDAYGGYRNSLFGDAAMEWKSRYGGDPAPANWWRVYQRHKNIDRNDLFGAALSANETREFKKADIDPGMRPEVIRENLNVRTRVILTGLSRIANSMRADGYSQEAIEAAIGMRLEMLPPAVNDTPEIRARISKILGTGGGGAPAATAPGPAAPPGGVDLRKKYGLE